MYVQRNIEARSHNHCYSVNAISVTYYECVFVTLGIHYAMRMRLIVICGLPDSYDIFPHYCFCNLRHQLCNAHAPYCHLRPARLLRYFSTLLFL